MKEKIEITFEERSYLLNDAVFYEILFAHGVSRHDRTDYCAWEHINHSRLGHIRALIEFFEGGKHPDDLSCEEFQFSKREVPITEDDRIRFRKDLFHLSIKRLRHDNVSKPWNNNAFGAVFDRSVEFVEHLLEQHDFDSFKVDRDKWILLLRGLKSGCEMEISAVLKEKRLIEHWIITKYRKLDSNKTELTILE